MRITKLVAATAMIGAATLGLSGSAQATDTPAKRAQVVTLVTADPIPERGQAFELTACVSVVGTAPDYLNTPRSGVTLTIIAFNERQKTKRVKDYYVHGYLTGGYWIWTPWGLKKVDQDWVSGYWVYKTVPDGEPYKSSAYSPVGTIVTGANGCGTTWLTFRSKTVRYLHAFAEGTDTLLQDYSPHVKISPHK